MSEEIIREADFYIKQIFQSYISLIITEEIPVEKGVTAYQYPTPFFQSYISLIITFF